MASNVMITLCFLAAVLGVYYLLPAKRRWIWLLLASYAFYMSVNPWMALLLMGSSLWAWFVGLRLERAREAAGEDRGESPGKALGNGMEKRGKGWLLGGILPLLAVLFLFKYLDFFIQSVSSLLAFVGLGFAPLAIRLLMPLGISYYTFKLLGYLVDVYRGKLPAERHPGFLVLYASFFPQILSGPIERAQELLPLFREPVFDRGLFSGGLGRIVLGLFKKMVIANRLSAYVNLVFAAPGDYPALAAWMAAFFYYVQLYAALSGYSDLALGLSDCMGIRCRENFCRPYFSTGIKEFWSRWHISLSSWLRDYVYIPLGGNRVSKARKNWNVFVTFLASGLWHGDNWTFLFWGGLHGFWNMAGKKPGQERGLRRLWKTVVTFAGVAFCWIFFRAESLWAAFSFLKRMVTGFSLSYGEIQAAILPFSGDNTCAALFLTVCLFIFLLFLYEWREDNRGRKGVRAVSVENGNTLGGQTEERGGLSRVWLVIFLISTLLFGVFGDSGFLYAQF